MERKYVKADINRRSKEVLTVQGVDVIAHKGRSFDRMTPLQVITLAESTYKKLLVYLDDRGTKKSIKQSLSKVKELRLFHNRGGDIGHDRLNALKASLAIALYHLEGAD